MVVVVVREEEEEEEEEEPLVSIHQSHNYNMQVAKNDLFNASPRASSSSAMRSPLPSTS